MHSSEPSVASQFPIRYSTFAPACNFSTNLPICASIYCNLLFVTSESRAPVRFPLGPGSLHQLNAKIRNTSDAGAFVPSLILPSRRFHIEQLVGTESRSLSASCAGLHVCFARHQENLDAVRNATVVGSQHCGDTTAPAWQRESSATAVHRHLRWHCDGNTSSLGWQYDGNTSSLG